VPAPPSALRLPAAVRARARAARRLDLAPKPVAARAPRRRLRVVEPPKRTPYPTEALEID
jgi:hypothetical protein